MTRGLTTIRALAVAATVTGIACAGKMAVVLVAVGGGLYAVSGQPANAAMMDNLQSYNPQADALVNPLPLVPANLTFEAYIPNPHPTWGNIVGLDAFDNGTKVGVLYANGNFSLHDSDFSNEILAKHLTGGTLTGLSAVPAGAANGGQIAVSGPDFIKYFDMDGNHTGGVAIPTSNGIQDISWDSAFGRMLLTDANGVHSVNADGSLNDVHNLATLALEAINMNDGYSDMFAQNQTFFLFNPDGTYDSSTPGKVTSYGSGLGRQGLAFTTSNGLVAGQNEVVVYAKAPFQDHMDYAVPEPATLALLFAGAIFASFHRGGRRHQNNTR